MRSTALRRRGSGTLRNHRLNVSFQAPNPAKVLMPENEETIPIEKINSGLRGKCVAEAQIKVSHAKEPRAIKLRLNPKIVLGYKRDR